MIIGIVSGKGGVGKTTITANLAATLASLNKKTLAIDLNVTTPNLGLCFGLLTQDRSIQKAMKGEMGLEDCIYPHHSGVHVIVADFYEDCDLRFLKESLETLPTYDFILLDGAAGIGREVEAVIQASDKILVVVNPTMLSVVSAAKVLRVIKKEGKEAEIIINKWGIGPKHITFKKIRELLDVPIMGVIPFDKKMAESCERNELIVLRCPNHKVTKSFKEIASILIGVPLEKRGVFQTLLLKVKRFFSIIS